MKTKSESFEYLKMFCGATLSFYGVMAIFYIFTLVFWYSDGSIAWQLYNLLASVTGFLLTFGTLLSALWFLITFVWGIVICKKETTTKVFANPIIIVNLLISLFLPFIVIPSTF